MHAGVACRAGQGPGYTPLIVAEDARPTSDPPSPGSPGSEGFGLHHPLAVCRRCGARLVRVRRSWLDRSISIAYPVKRYRCPGARCGRTVLIGSRSQVERRTAIVRSVVVTLALMLLATWLALKFGGQ